MLSAGGSWGSRTTALDWLSTGTETSLAGTGSPLRVVGIRQPAPERTVLNRCLRTLDTHHAFVVKIQDRRRIECESAVRIGADKCPQRSVKDSGLLRPVRRGLKCLGCLDAHNCVLPQGTAQQLNPAPVGYETVTPLAGTTRR